MKSIEEVNAELNLTEYQQYDTSVIIDNHRIEKEEVSAVSAQEYYLLQFIGPVQESWKQYLKEYGVMFYYYIPHYTFKVQMNPEKLEDIRKINFVKSITLYKPAYKVPADVQLKLDTVQEDQTFLVNVFLHKKEDAEKIIQALGNSVVTSQENNLQIHATKKQLISLTQQPEIAYVEQLPELSVYNDRGREVLQVPGVENDLGLDGEGQIIGILDTGLDTGDLQTIHPDIRGRVISLSLINGCSGCSSPDDENGHGTHVTGSALGDGNKSNLLYKGTAPQAELFFTAMGTDDGQGLSLSTPGQLQKTLNDAYDKNTRIHSNSWGHKFPDGSYNSLSQKVDDFMWNNKDILIYFAAGNSGGNGDNTVGYPATAKNTLTIGSVLSKTLSGTNDDPDVIASSSSRGPTDDGRVKPDLVGPGQFIYSLKSSIAQPCVSSGATNDYSYCSGTSMATPLAAGVGALVRQDLLLNQKFSNPSAALIKALLINGAVQLPGHSLPSNASGWGRINLTNTLLPTGNIYIKYVDEQLGIQTTQEKNYPYNVATDKPLKITLVWTDATPANVNNNPLLVNDLNLEVISPSGTIYYGNDFISPFNDVVDVLNNVEQIVINIPEQGSYTVKIKGFNIPQGPQPFALVVRGALYLLPTINGFDGTTTIFETVSDLKQVQNLTLEKSKFGKIVWDKSVYVLDQDLSNNIIIQNNFVYVNSNSLHSSFNKSATVSLENISFAIPHILKDGTICNDCVVESYVDNKVTFNVKSFSNYSVIEGATSVLDIWDSGDDKPFGNNTIYQFQQATILANFTNRTDGTPLLDANCSLNFIGTNVPMKFNATKNLYEFTDTLPESGIFTYNVSCSHPLFDMLNATGNITVLDSIIFTPHAPENLRIKKTDNTTITLSWNPVADAVSYNIYYNDNATVLLQLALATAQPQVSGLTDSYYLDSELVGQRYYAIAAINGTNKNLSSAVIARFDLAITVPQTIISLPLILDDLNISKAFDNGNENDMIYSYDTALNKTVAVQRINQNWYGDFSLVSYDKAYVFKPTADYNITLIGTVPTNNYTLSLVQSSGIPGTGREVNLAGWFSSQKKCGFSTLLSQAKSGDSIFAYNSASKTYDTAVKQSDGSWQGTLDCFEPGRGYEFRKVTQDYLWEYQR